MKNSTRLAIASFVCIAATGLGQTASAGDLGGYAFAAFGPMGYGSDQADLDSALSSASASNFGSSISNATIATLELGYKFNPYLAVEGGYFGTISKESYSANVSGANIAVKLGVNGAKMVGVAIAPLSQSIGIFAKLGLADLRTSAEISGTNGSLSAAGSDSASKAAMTYGVGASFTVDNQFFLRADIDRYTLGLSGGTSTRTAATLGAGFHF